MTQPTPTSFLSAPGYGLQGRPAPAPIFAQQAAPPLTAAPRPTGTLTVHADGTIYIDAKSARLLPAGDNTIDLRQPVREGRGDSWHLDCRVGGLCTRRANGASGGIRFRAQIRVQALIGCLPGPVAFEFEHVGNDLFRLYPLGGDKS
jgi:hypothetical protein